MTVKYYKNKEERKTLIKAQHKLGKALIHDDFIDKDSNATDGLKGKLTFDIIPETTTNDHTRIKELRIKIKNDTMSLNDIKEWLKLTV